MKTEKFDMYSDLVRKPALQRKSEGAEMNWYFSRFQHLNYCYCQSSIHDPLLASCFFPCVVSVLGLYMKNEGKLGKGEKINGGKSRICSVK